MTFLSMPRGPLVLGELVGAMQSQARGVVFIQPVSPANTVRMCLSVFALALDAPSCYGLPYDLSLEAAYGAHLLEGHWDTAFVEFAKSGLWVPKLPPSLEDSPELVRKAGYAVKDVVMFDAARNTSRIPLRKIREGYR